MFARTNTSNKTPKDKKRPIVLVAEDNDVNQLVIRKFLDQYDCDVKIAADGKKAVHFYNQHPFDVVIMDIDMPIMDGFEATQNIRTIEKQSKKRAIPVIAFTAHIRPSDQHLCIQAGMNDYVQKPLNAALLSEKLQIWAPHLKFKPRGAAA